MPSEASAAIRETCKKREVALGRYEQARWLWPATVSEFAGRCEGDPPPYMDRATPSRWMHPLPVDACHQWRSCVSMALDANG